MRGVEIILNTRVAAVSDDSVTLANGTRIPTAMIIWTAGTTPNPLLDALPCAKDRGRVVVNEYLQIPDFPNVWVVGDCAATLDQSTGLALPADGATRPKTGSNGSLQRQCCNSRAIGEEVLIPRPRADGFHRKTHRGRGRPRHQVLRLCGLVVMADRLPSQAAGLGPKSPRRNAMDSGSDLFERFNSVSDRACSGYVAR